jgi:diketogulonate reductase-like aldo/keto reductase
MAANRPDRAAILSNGVVMPRLGLGVFRIPEGEAVEQAVAYAFQVGYRHIDTARSYGNEAGVGQAVRESGLPREQVFVTTKVWNDQQGYDSTLKAYEASLARLGLDYADLYLVHWPVKGQYKETWRALETLYEEKRVRAIGVCNFHVHHLEDLLAGARVAPMVNQIELHPFLTQEDIRGYCRDYNIQVEAWAPLVRGHLDHPLFSELAASYGRTPAQIVLRWHVQHDVVVIPKSVQPARILENQGIFDFELTAADVARIDGLNQNQRFGPDPDNFSF